MIGTKTFLYTKGKEFSLSGLEYIGYYHILNSVPYAGAKHTSKSKKLYPYRNYNPAAMRYDFIKPEYNKLATFIKPYRASIQVTDSQYKVGKFIRYFMKRINDPVVFEITESMAAKYGTTGGFDDMMYQLVSMPWKVTIGSATYDVVEHNRKALAKAELEMPGIKKIIHSLFEYSIVDITP